MTEFGADDAGPAIPEEWWKDGWKNEPSLAVQHKWFEDKRKEAYRRLRKRWISGGMQWWSPVRNPPEGRNPERRLKEAGLGEEIN